MRITVTQDMINRGVRNNARKCPVALALKEAGLTRVVVCGGVDFGPVPYRQSILLNRRVLCFIGRFDHGKPVKPFSFTI